MKKWKEFFEEMWLIKNKQGNYVFDEDSEWLLEKIVEVFIKVESKYTAKETKECLK
jgi:hypothetical protein